MLERGFLKRKIIAFENNFDQRHVNGFFEPLKLKNHLRISISNLGKIKNHESHLELCNSYKKTV